ncbi:tripartite tricarboxylate transporter permease [Paraburkholderia xenovorans]|jgi:putative tricarboxylic transport membrane protein|uniref:tripartite tricarboxylate transporter permease n=1 Tax=Paraburkholderia xenovorans TaxID=36873 RepID=UPI0015584A97|nr:tripartite tricarboxylate transporter permease [Paraburkholderia xenovorans]NPT39417.1 tripartite tricarboxylate transporter permease [Paraburkholderia xenovorans]
MDSLQGILHGLAVAATPMHLMYTLFGVFIGTMISHLPGIGPSAGIALLIPVTFGMDPISALMMLTGIYYGCMYGGAVTAILLNTPGDAAAVMTVLDGYPLARKGRAAATLAIAAVSSFMAGMMGVTALAFVAAPLAAVALHFGPTEYFALICFALSTVGALTGDSLGKGMMAVFLGLGLATVGIDLQSGVPRFTLGLTQLQDRVNFLVVVVGLFAIAEVSRMVEGTLGGTLHTVRVEGKLWFTRQEWRRARPAIFRGSAVGFICGAAPGLGGTLAAMLSYVLEKKISKHPEEFGHGAIEGVAAPEAATNADTCGAFVHLLALGVPGSGATAVIMGAFIMYGIQPGPMLFHTQPDLVWGLIASMYIGNIMLLLLNLPLVGILSRILYVPSGVLLCLILVIASAGVYSFSNDVFDLFLALFFGIVGYAFRKFDIPKAPLLFGLILGHTLEQSFRQALTISNGDPSVFLRSPIAASLLGCAAISVAASVWSRRRKSSKLVREVEEQVAAAHRLANERH